MCFNKPAVFQGDGSQTVRGQMYELQAQMDKHL